MGMTNVFDLKVFPSYKGSSYPIWTVFISQSSSSRLATIIFTHITKIMKPMTKSYEKLRKK